MTSAGLLVPDIPLEETDEIRVATSAHGLELVLLTTPTTPQERMKKIAESSQGFVYLVSLTGARRGAAERMRSCGSTHHRRIALHHMAHTPCLLISKLAFVCFRISVQA